MGQSLDDLYSTPDEEAPTEPVVGAPEPGQKQSYDRAGPAPAQSSLDALYADDPPPDRTQAEMDASHPMFGQEPGAPHAPGAIAYGQNLLKKIPLVGGPAAEVSNWAAVGSNPLLRAELEAAQANTDKAHPYLATAGDITGSAGGLAAITAMAPEVLGVNLFGLNAATKTAGAALGAGSTATVGVTDRLINNLIQGEPWDKGMGIAAGVGATGGALGGAVSAAFNRGFNAVIKPGLEDLARKAIVDNKIPLPAGMIAANPLLARLPGEMLSTGAGAKALDAWHRAIVRTVGEDAPRLTSKVLGDASKRIADRMQVLSQLPPGTKWASKEMGQLAEQAQNVRALESVTKINRGGLFSPEEFHDAMANTLGEAFTKGDNKLADLATIGTTFLKGAPSPKFDAAAAWRLAKGFAGFSPAAVPHLLTHGLHSLATLPDPSVAGAIGAAVGGVKLLGKAVGAIGARSTKVANALVGQSVPILSPVMGVARPAAAGLVRPLMPGLAQQAVPALVPPPAPPDYHIIHRSDLQ